VPGLALRARAIRDDTVSLIARARNDKQSGWDQGLCDWQRRFSISRRRHSFSTSARRRASSWHNTPGGTATHRSQTARVCATGY
jgi:hypothetical protein